MSNSQLQAHENNWQTRIGKAFLCDRAVLRGRDLHHELGDWNWFAVYLYGITGREFSENLSNVKLFMVMVGHWQKLTSVFLIP